jgi:hypothetical protein
VSWSRVHRLVGFHPGSRRNPAQASESGAEWWNPPCSQLLMFCLWRHNFASEQHPTKPHLVGFLPSKAGCWVAVSCRHPHQSRAAILLQRSSQSFAHFQSVVASLSRATPVIPAVATLHGFCFCFCFCVSDVCLVGAHHSPLARARPGCGRVVRDQAPEGLFLVVVTRVRAAQRA